jgi:hypothetical protein
MTVSCPVVAAGDVAAALWHALCQGVGAGEWRGWAGWRREARWHSLLHWSAARPRSAVRAALVGGGAGSCQGPSASMPAAAEAGRFPGLPAC